MESYPTFYMQWLVIGTSTIYRAHMKCVGESQFCKVHIQVYFNFIKYCHNFSQNFIYVNCKMLGANADDFINYF